jgi:hypothetical protein
MRSPSKRPAILLLLLLALAAPAAAADPDEDVFGRLFRLHLEGATGDVAIAAQAGQAAAALPPGPYRAAARAVQGWRLLRAGKPAEAAAVYQTLLADPASPAALAELARRWLTRLDRETVRDALRKAWARDIRYPATLEALPAPQPPLTDRWNRPWSYKTRGLKLLQADAQRYDLQSAALGADSDLAAAVALPWPTDLPLRAVGLTPAANATTLVTFETVSKSPPEKPVLSEGKAWGGLMLLKVGPKALLIVHGDYVFLPLKPGY